MIIAPALEITRIEELQALVRHGFTDWRSLGNVYAKYHNGLVLFNYTPEAQYAGRWNWFERVSRGLILDVATGAIVARPFDKFFNWGEGGRTSNAPITSVTEKMDGSLGILYRHKNEYHIATRGGFDGPQAQWATEWYRCKFGHLIFTHHTLLFEIIYPENRIVVDYGARAELVLLAMRHRETGLYLTRESIEPLQEVGLKLAPVHDLRDPNSLLSLCANLDVNQEGFVAEFADGQHFKFKGSAYVEMHRLLAGITFKNTLQAVTKGRVEEFKAAIPDEFLGQFNEWVEEINAKCKAIYERVELDFSMAPQGDRREFAKWVQAFAPSIAPYLFLKYEGRDYVPLIYKREFKD